MPCRATSVVFFSRNKLLTQKKNDFILNPINPPQQRAQSRSKSKGAKAQEVVYPSSQEWALDAEGDMDTRRACEAS